jgi:hypothetical protein
MTDTPSPWRTFCKGGVIVLQAKPTGSHVWGRLCSGGWLSSHCVVASRGPAIPLLIGRCILSIGGMSVGRRGPKYSEKHLPQWTFVHHKSQNYCYEIQLHLTFLSTINHKITAMRFSSILHFTYTNTKRNSVSEHTSQAFFFSLQDKVVILFRSWQPCDSKRNITVWTDEL